MRRLYLCAFVVVTSFATPACGIRSPSQQCQIVTAREVACGQLAADQSASAKYVCTTNLTHASSDCQHAYDSLAGCLDNFSCYDLQSGACDDVYGNAAPLCPSMFGEANDVMPSSADSNSSLQPIP